MGSGHIDRLFQLQHLAAGRAKSKAFYYRMMAHLTSLSSFWECGAMTATPVSPQLLQILEESLPPTSK